MMDEYLLTSAHSEHLRYLEQTVGLGIWSWSLADDRLRWSDGLFRTLGLDPQQTVPSFALYRKIVHPDDRLDFTNMESIVNTRRLSHRRFRIIRPTGEMRWIESRGQLMHEADGRASRMLGFAIDVTETKEASDTSAAFKSLLQAVRELMGGRIWQTAPDGAVVDEIDWWQSWGGSRPPSGQWSRLDSVHPEDVAKVRDAWTAAIETQSTYRSSFRLKQPDGRYESFSSVAMPVRSDEGATLGWIGASRAADLPAAARYLEAGEVPAALFRAARAYLDLSGDAFALQSGVSYSTIRRLESAKPTQVGATVRQQVVDFLEARGVRFTVDASGSAQLLLTGRSRG